MEAFFTNDLYTRSSWTALNVCILHIFTGDVVIRYILNLLVQDLMPDNAQIALTITQFFSMLSLIGSVFTIRYIGRKTLLFWGHFFIAIEMICIGVFQIMGWSLVSYVFVCAEMITYNLTTLQVAWIFASEVCVDSALGVVIAGLFIAIVVADCL